MKKAMKPNLNILRYLLAFFPLAALALCVGILAFFFYKQTPEIFSSSERAFFKTEYEELAALEDAFSRLPWRDHLPPPLERFPQASAREKRVREELIGSLFDAYRDFGYYLLHANRSFSFWIFQEFDDGSPYPALLQGYASYLRNTMLPSAERLNAGVPVLLDYYGEAIRPYVVGHQEYLEQYITRVRKTLDYLDSLRPFLEKAVKGSKPDNIDLRALFASSTYPDDVFAYTFLEPKDFPYIDASALAGKSVSAMTPEYIESLRKKVRENAEAMRGAIQDELSVEHAPVTKERYTLLGSLYCLLPDHIDWMLADNATTFHIFDEYQENGPRSQRFYYYPVVRIISMAGTARSLPLRVPMASVDGKSIFSGTEQRLLEDMAEWLIEYVCIRNTLSGRSIELWGHNGFDFKLP